MAVKVAVVTGGNSGIGLSLCERLLAEHDTDKIRLCLACRNHGRATSARNHLLALYPTAVIDIVLADFSSVHSVKKAAAEMRTKFTHIDFLFLNAGIMPNPRLDLAGTFQTLFSREVFSKLSSGDGFLQYNDDTTVDGLQLTFATNVFGHFVLVHEIESILGGSIPTQIIWTSSRAANKEMFNCEDLQHRSGRNPYASSKYLTDIISIALNDKFNEKNIYSYTVCPGLVMTPLAYAILPQWIWTYGLVPVCKTLRYFVPSFTLDGDTAVEALVWLTKQQPAALDVRTKYCSSAGITGRPYVRYGEIDAKQQECDDAYAALTSMYSSFCAGDGCS